MTTASSTILPVESASTLYRLVSSITVIAEQTLVSLKSAMKSLVTGGITIRTACGTSTCRRACHFESPSDRLASNWPRGTALSPAR